MIRVRFAPSPTGYLHIGGVRTALFNYLYARNQGGCFILRIEDTDRLRSKPEFEEEIIASLKWLGLTWDEELVYQSRRIERYSDYARRLTEHGLAYEQVQDGKKAVLLKMPKKEVVFTDLVHGETRFDTSLFDDLVLMKSDGFPTYHFACVVDDHEMEISHVIRGDDHLSNTPRQIVIYESLGWKPPKFAHLPLIMGSDGSPLSKRHGAVAASAYMASGYLPEGLLNYLALMGWGSGSNQEIFSLPELCKKFSLKNINKGSATFNPDKLNWINSQHIKKLSDDAKFYPEKSAAITPEKWKRLAVLFKTRIQNFADLGKEAPYVFEDVEIYDEALVRQYSSSDALMDLLAEWTRRASALASFEDEQALEQLTRQLCEEKGMPAKEIIHPLRFILSGKTVSPGLFELMNVLGRETCLKRMERFAACRPEPGR